MFTFIKNIYIYILKFFSDSYTVSKVYRKYYGVKIGKNVRFTDKYPHFGSEPYLVEIGNNVTITYGVVFHTHDGGVGIFRKEISFSDFDTWRRLPAFVFTFVYEVHGKIY